MQFQGNTVPKKGNTVVCTELPFFDTAWLFSCTSLIGNSMISRAICQNTHLWVFQRPQIALVVRTCAILTVRTVRVFLPNCTWNHAITCTKQMGFKIQLTFPGVSTSVVGKWQTRRFFQQIRINQLATYWNQYEDKNNYLVIGSIFSCPFKWFAKLLYIQHCSFM